MNLCIVEKLDSKIINKNDSDDEKIQVTENKMVDYEDDEKDFFITQTILKSERKYFWRMNDPIRVKWDLLIMTLTIINCFIVPFDVSFKPHIFYEVWIQLLYLIVDFIFMADIAVCFRTSFIQSKTGEEEIDLIPIAKNYLQGAF